MARLKKAVIDKVLDDIDLFYIVGKAVGVKASSIADTVRRNGNVVNQYHVVKLIADYLKTNAEELVEPELQEQR